MPCQYAASWILNFIQPVPSAIKGKREGNAQDLAASLRVLTDLEQIILRGMGHREQIEEHLEGDGYQVLGGDGYHGGEYQVVDQRDLWETIVPNIASQGPQRLAQLTVEELLGAIPPAARHTLEALGLPAAAAAELQQMQQQQQQQQQEVLRIEKC